MNSLYTQHLKVFATNGAGPLAAELAHQEHVFRASLKQAREAKGMSLADVAEKLGISEAMAAEVESTAINLTMSEIRYYCWAVGIYYTTEIHDAEELIR